MNRIIDFILPIAKELYFNIIVNICIYNMLPVPQTHVYEFILKYYASLQNSILFLLFFRIVEDAS